MDAEGHDEKVVDQTQAQDKDVGLLGEVGNGPEPCHDGNRGGDRDGDLVHEERVGEDNVISCLSS